MHVGRDQCCPRQCHKSRGRFPRHWLGLLQPAAQCTQTSRAPPRHPLYDWVAFPRMSHTSPRLVLRQSSPSPRCASDRDQLSASTCIQPCCHRHGRTFLQHGGRLLFTLQLKSSACYHALSSLICYSHQYLLLILLALSDPVDRLRRDRLLDVADRASALTFDSPLVGPKGLPVV